MYIPKYHRVESRERLLAFMRENSFATLVTISGQAPFAAHLPLLVSVQDNSIKLKGHLARANPQWKSFKENGEVLVIFQGPHAYISPSLYETSQNVPTWNYVAIHAYGVATVISGSEAANDVMMSMIEYFEASYRAQWDELPEQYKNRVLSGIVVFEIDITRLEGSFKLSQNHSRTEQVRIIESLGEHQDSTIAGVARIMKSNLADGDDA